MRVKTISEALRQANPEIQIGHQRETRNSEPETARNARLYRVLGPLVFGASHALFDRRIGDGEDRDRDQT